MVPALHRADAVGILVPWICPEWDRGRVVREIAERQEEARRRVAEIEAEVEAAVKADGMSSATRRLSESADKRKVQIFQSLHAHRSHPVLRYLDGHTRYDLDAPVEPGSEVTPRHYLLGVPTVEIHLQRVSRKDWSTLRQMATPTLPAIAKARPDLSLDDATTLAERDNIMRDLAAEQAIRAGISAVMVRGENVPVAADDTLVNILHGIDANLVLTAYAAVMAYGQSLTINESLPSA